METAVKPTTAATPAQQSRNTPPAATETSVTAEFEKLSFTELLERKPSFDVLKRLGLAKLTHLVVDAVTSEKSLKDEIDATKEAMSVQYKPAGKVLAALQTSFEEDVANADIRAGTTFAAYYEERTSKKLDSGRASQCCRVFRKLVIPEMLAESDYDNVAVDWLEKTSKIIDLCVKQGKTMTCDEMLDVLNILKVRPDTGAKRLRLIKNKLEGKETVTADGKGPELNPQSLVAIVKRGIGMSWPVGGHGLLLVMSEIIAAVKTAKDLPADVAKQFYFASYALGDAFGELPEEMVVAWTAEREQASTGPMIVAAPDFAAHVQKIYEGLDAEMVPMAAAECQAYYVTEKRLPASADELDAWVEKNPGVAPVNAPAQAVAA